MSSTIGSYLPSLLNSARNGYAAAAAQPSLVDYMGDDSSDPSAASPSTNVTLSDGAKAHLAKMAANVPASSDSPSADADASVASDVADNTGSSSTSDTSGTSDASDPADGSTDPVAAMRTWFDDQYDKLSISSAMLDGKVAVDLSSQSREVLSAVASNADGVFSKDESAAATSELNSRFNNAMASHVVVARHTGDYGSLYQAASDYLDQAGDAEKATDAWKAQKQAVTDGLSAAKASFGKAPDTGNSNDPVRTLLDQPTSNVSSIGPDSTTQEVATYARAMLDDQASRAKDNGTELVFNSSRKTGQLVDFSNFDNRTLATIALNQDSSFSSEETYAAKTELEQRTRTNMVSTMNSSSGDSNSSGPGGMIQNYLNMSDEEKQVLGVTDDVTNKLIQSYKTMMSVQNTLGGGSGLAAYL